MISSPHLLLLAGVGGHTPQEALVSLAAITRRVSMLFIDAWVPADRIRTLWEESKLDGELVVVSTLDEAVEAACALHARNALDGVVTYSELLLQPHARITARLGLPGSPVEAVEIAQSKARQRVVFAEKGVASPRFAVISQAEQVEAGVAHVGLPAVFKPSLGAGSVGVHRVHTLEQVQASFQTFLKQASTFLQHDPHVLLEEPMPLEGDADSPYANYVSVESLLIDGEAIHLTVTDRARLRHGYVEEGLIMPSRLPEQQQQRLIEEAERAIRAIGLTHGAVHTEVAWIHGEPKIIEVNARAGGPIPSMFESAANYDYAAEIARAYLNIRSGLKPQFQRVSWHRFVPIPEGEWKVVSQTPVAEVMARLPGIVYLSPRFQPGQKVSRQLTLHLASFMVTAPTAEEARALVAEVEKVLAIRLEPVMPEAMQAGGLS